jgi:hypothetical protein
MTAEKRIAVPRRTLGWLLALGALGAAAGLLGSGGDRARVWLNVLVDGFYFLSLGVSAIFFLATQRLTGARWSAGLRRIPEALMLTTPIAAVIMLALFAGHDAIYPWAAPGGLAEAPVAAGKNTYLAPGFVHARMAAVLVIWVAFAWRITRTSRAQDRDPDGGISQHLRLNRQAALFAPVFAVTITLAAYDWIISLEPDWFSTMFAVYVFAGTFVHGIAAVALAAVILRRTGHLRDQVGDRQLHDLGVMLFAFSTFWAYIWVCQYLLIWYGNIPEEATYYLRRTGGAWLPLFLANLAVNWVLPFCALLSARAKRSPRVLACVCLVLLLGRWLDLYIMVMPSSWTAPQLGPTEIGLALAGAAIFALSAVLVLARAALVPTSCPLLADRRSRGGES